MKISKGKFPLKNKKKSYVIYKNGEHFEMLYDMCEGYSLIMEDIRKLKKRDPNSKWVAVEYNNHLEIKNTVN